MTNGSPAPTRNESESSTADQALVAYDNDTQTLPQPPPHRIPKGMQLKAFFRLRSVILTYSRETLLDIGKVFHGLSSDLEL